MYVLKKRMIPNCLGDAKMSHLSTKKLVSRVKISMWVKDVCQGVHKHRYRLSRTIHEIQYLGSCI